MLAVPDTVNILAMEQVISNKRDAIDRDQGKDAIVLALHGSTDEAPWGATHPPQVFLCGGGAALKGAMAALGETLASL